MAGTDLMPTGAADTFTGTTGAAFNATNWTTVLNQGTGGSATIQSNQGRIGSGTVAGNRTSVKANTAARLDQEVVFDWVVPAANTEFAFLWVRANSTVDTASGYYITLDNNTMDVGYAETTSAYNRYPIQTLTHGFVAGQLVRTRFAVFGGTGTKTLKVRTWLVGNAENTNVWQASVTDTHVVNTAGVIGLTMASATAGTKYFFVDNFDITDTETPTQKTVALTGSVTAAGTLIKVMPKLLTGSVASAGTLLARRVVIRVFSGAVALAGPFRKMPIKPFTGSIALSGTYRNFLRKTLVGAISTSGTIMRLTRRKFLGAISATGSMNITPLGRVFGVPGIVVVSIRKAGELRARFRRT